MCTPLTRTPFSHSLSLPVNVECLDFNRTVYFTGFFPFPLLIPFSTLRRITFSTCELCCCSELESRMLKAFVGTYLVYVAVTEIIAVSCKYTQSSLVYTNIPNQVVQRW